MVYMALFWMDQRFSVELLDLNHANPDFCFIISKWNEQILMIAVVSVSVVAAVLVSCII